MKKLLYLTIAFIGFFVCKTSDIHGQGVGINSSGNPPHPSALLDVSGVSKGVLINRMTTAQRDSIINPAEGLQIFNTTTKCFEYFAYGLWQTLGCATCPTQAPPTAGTQTATPNQIVWSWNAAPGAIGYKWNTVNVYSSASDIGTGTTYTQSGLSCNTSYSLYVWAYNTCGISSAVVLTKSTCCDGTGGTITHVSGNTIHTFLVAQSGQTFTPPACVSNIQVLVVAGGGGGGGCASGGGAGGLIYNPSYNVTLQSYTVTVGNGGSNGGNANCGFNCNQGGNGGNSVFGTLTAIGGGGGGGCNAGGKNGGSGGGASWNGGTLIGGTGTSGQGNNGGSNTINASPYPGAGGGGAGGVGGSPTATVAGSGGPGLAYNISGSSVYYAGGGGGGGYPSVTPGSGGNGGGAAGCGNCNGFSGTDNTGGGGGGGNADNTYTGGAGGSGIVIISYPTP